MTVNVMGSLTQRYVSASVLDPIRDIQILCPMNRGGLGARSLNIDLQKALNPLGEKNREIRIDVCAQRQGGADRERLRQGGL